MCLQVLESGGSVSSSVLFEYRARNASSLPSSQLDWLSLDGQCQSPSTPHVHADFLSVPVLDLDRCESSARSQLGDGCRFWVINV